jgi:hypothetical protein
MNAIPTLAKFKLINNFGSLLPSIVEYQMNISFKTDIAISAFCISASFVDMVGSLEESFRALIYLPDFSVGIFYEN